MCTNLVCKLMHIIFEVDISINQGFEVIQVLMIKVQCQGRRSYLTVTLVWRPHYQIIIAKDLISVSYIIRLYNQNQTTMIKVDSCNIILPIIARVRICAKSEIFVIISPFEG
jgi:hypothetical protein